jgi:argininosuccinate lyase
MGGPGVEMPSSGLRWIPKRASLKLTRAGMHRHPNPMWQGRFSEKPSDLLKAYGESVSVDWRLYAHDIRGSIAHARALKQAGILDAVAFDAIEQGLLAIRAEIEAGQFVWRVGLEDVHMNIEAALTERIGEAGARLHTARSRNDQVALDLRLWMRDAVTGTLEAIRGLQRSLCGLARRHQAAVLPGYTHLQRAQPVLAAHHLLAYVEMLERDAQRLSDCRTRMDVLPLGSGALAGSTICLDREAIAAELGFARVSTNSMDAVADRDFAVEAVAALALLGIHLSRLSEDIILWTSTEFGFLHLSDRHTTGSSLMPQKKNPDIAELTRGRTGRLVGNLVALLTMLKGLPLTYNRDMQEDKAPVFDSFDTVNAALAILAEMLAFATLDEGKAFAAASDPALLATDLADRLVLAGVPFRLAHEKVGRLVAESVARGVPLDRLPESVTSGICPELGREEFASVFSIPAALAARRATGAPSHEGVAAQLGEWEARLSP